LRRLKIVTVVGSKKSGKTTVVCKLVQQLKSSGLKVATVKYLERSPSIDINDKETYRHRKAGADIAIASGLSETAILKKIEQRETLAQLMGYLTRDIDYVVCEGIDDKDVARIVAVREPSEIENYLNKMTIAISGIVAGKSFAHRLPVVDVTRNAEKLARIVRSLSNR
jgi:molybdopterin-guanine dinucleotide biosynthesis protein MobB